jgi:hypothetical protein
MTNELTQTLTPQIATQTSYAVYAARKAKEEELHACIRGWGNIETQMSGKLREEVAALLALQIYWQDVASEMLNAQIKKEFATMVTEVKAIKARNGDKFRVGDRVRYSTGSTAYTRFTVFGVVTKVNQASYVVTSEDGRKATIKKSNVFVGA